MQPAAEGYFEKKGKVLQTDMTRNMAVLSNSRSGLALKNQAALAAHGNVYNQIQIKEQSPMKINAKKKAANQVVHMHQM